MPAPSFVAAGTVTSATGGVDVPYYPGLQVNDIACILIGGYLGANFGTVTGFTGETQITTAGVRTRFYWKRLTGSESGTVNVPEPDSAFDSTAVMFGIRNAIPTGTPYEGYATNTGTGTTVTSPSTVTAGDDRLMFRAYVDEGNSSAPPATWTERYEGSSVIWIFGDTKERASAGTETATSRTGAFSEPWATFGLAFIPAPLVFVGAQQILMPKRRRKVVAF